MVRREEVQWWVREVMEGNMSDEFKRNAIDWSHKAKKAMGEGGSSNISDFLSKYGVPIDGQHKYLNNIALHHQPHIIVHLYGIIKRTKTPNDPGILFFHKFKQHFKNADNICLFFPKKNIYCQHF
jgi:hypothetical protein